MCPPHPKMFAVHLTVTNDAPFAFNYATSSPLPRCIANFTGCDMRPAMLYETNERILHDMKTDFNIS